MISLNEKIALITGAGANIGEGVAHVLAAQGAIVMVNDLDVEQAERVAHEIRLNGFRAYAAPFDITNREEVVAAVEAIAQNAKPVDILVNNAGHVITNDVKFADTAPETWQKGLDLNILGTYNCVHAVLKDMIKQRSGRIIMHTSGAGQTGLNIGVSTYGAAKAAQIGFMRHLAVENAPYGITCNAISIGLIVKDTTGVPELANSIPMGRVGKPEDIGHMAAFLASDEAEWITGQVFGVNGGALMI